MKEDRPLIMDITQTFGVTYLAFLPEVEKVAPSRTVKSSYLLLGSAFGVYKKRIYRPGTGRGTVQKGGVIFHKPDGVSFYVVIFWGDPVFTCVGSG